jgi:hypothetical protein
MKKMIFLFLASVSICQTAFAALPPFAQNLREVEAILTNEQLTEQLGYAQPLDEIKKVDGGYVIITSGKELRVDVIYKPQSMPGPAKFDLKFHAATPISAEHNMKILSTKPAF